MIEFGITWLELSTLKVLVRIQLIVEATPVFEYYMNAFLQSIHLHIAQRGNKATQIFLNVCVGVYLHSLLRRCEKCQFSNYFFLEVT